MVRTVVDPRQRPLFVPETTWRHTNELPSLAGRRRVALDTETEDPGISAEKGSSWAYPGEGRLVGVSVALDGWSTYYPLFHPEGNVENPEAILRWLAYELKLYEGTVVGMALDYDLGWLRRYGIDAPRARLYDVQVGETLLDEDRLSYSLDAIAASYGLPLKDEALLREAAAAYGFPKSVKANLHRLPGQLVGAYGQRDGELPLELMDRQWPLLEAQDLLRCCAVEQRLVRLNTLMRERGVRIDLDRCEVTKKRLVASEKDCLLEIKSLTGLDVEVWVNSSVAQAFLAAGVDFPTTVLHQPSFQQEWLDSHPHPLAKLVRQARKYNKGWSTFIDGMILRHVDKNGRLHPHWRSSKSTDEVTGSTKGTIARYACTDPNLQQVPSPDARSGDREMGPLIRSLFVPDEGAVWFTGDVKQQEPRLGVHFAALRKFPGALAAAQQIRDDPNIDYHQMVSDITKLPRRQAKDINLAKYYGLGGAKLCRKLGLPTNVWRPKEGVYIDVAGEEGRAIIREYDERFPFVKALIDECTRLADERGYIRTLLGRRARFNLWQPRDTDFNFYRGLPLDRAREEYGDDLKRAYLHKATNRLIQGSAADMMKLIMLHCHDELGTVPLAVVHDELDDCVATVDDARKLDACIRSAVKLLVPTMTDVELGPSWGETRKVVL